MNHNGDDPGELGGLGDVLPAEVLKKLNELLERLHHAVHPNHGGSVVNYFQGATIHNLVINGNMTKRGTEHYHTEEASQRREQEAEKGGVPTAAEMQAAVEETVRRGLWWSNRSWSVAYRVYQMKGYQQSIKQFVRDVSGWNIAKGFECNYDAVQKPIAQGLLIGDPKKWVDNGAQKQAPALAEAMLNLLDNKCIPSLNE